MAVSFRLAARPTDEEILELAGRNPGLQIEQSASGELLLTPTGYEAGRREAALVAQLDRWATEEGGVVSGPSAGFRLPDGSLLCPDASWLRRERYEALTPSQRRHFAPLCPDAVFEIRSHSDTLAHLRSKMRTYVDNGARLAVLIDPRRRAVEIVSADGARVLEAVQSVSLDPVLPGFTLDLTRIFQ